MITCPLCAVEAGKNEHIRAVIVRTDAALYRAKQSGRRRVELDDPQTAE